MQADVESLEELDLQEEVEAEGSDELSFDDLVNEALQEADAKARIKQLKKQAPGKELAGLQEWAARQEWDTQANVALFLRQTCKCCGITRSYFLEFMLRQTHRTKAGTIRWVKTQEPVRYAPKEVAYKEETVQLCVLCAHDKGWDLINGTVLCHESKGN